MLVLTLLGALASSVAAGLGLADAIEGGNLIHQLIHGGTGAIIIAAICFWILLFARLRQKLRST